MNSDQRSEEQLECLSLSHCELIYNTIFFKSLATGGNVSSALAEAGQNACYQTLISNQGCIFLLGIHKVFEIHLRDWSERIDFYIENNKNQYEQALELAYSMLVGKAKGLTGLPIDRIKRRQCISDRMVSLLHSYLKYSLNYQCPQSGKIDLLKQHYRNILPRSIDYCLLIDRLDLLFGLIYDIFSKDSIAHGIYLQCLEPYILTNRFDTISPNVLKDFINYYIDNNYLNQLEQCLNRLDVSCLDLEQVINITRKYELYMTLLHIYSEAFKDFTTILKEIIEKLEDDFAQNNGKLFLHQFIKHNLKGVLKYKGRNLQFPRSSDLDRYSLERAIKCVLLQSTARETLKVMGKLKRSRIILIQFCLITPTEYRAYILMT